MSHWNDISIEDTELIVQGYAPNAVLRRRTRFTMSLFAFSLAFLAQSAVSTVTFYYFAHHYTASVAIPLMPLMILEVAGLASLLYVVQS